MEWTKHYRKAVTFSYDDGNTQDIRLTELFNHYGLKATFNLNSGLESDASRWLYKDVPVVRLRLPENREVYRGHEIAVHGREHLCLTQLTDDRLDTELRENARELERIFGERPVGMAYAYGAYDDRVIQTLRDMGIRYARTTHSSHSFAVQEDLLQFDCTCHHNDPELFTLAETFLTGEPDAPWIFSIWGHSYELDGDHSWDRLVRLCECLAGREDVFYGTNAQVLL